MSNGKAEPGPAPNEFLTQTAVRNKTLQITKHDWDKACLEYFKAKYLQRLQKSHWANGKTAEHFRHTAR